MNNFSVSNHRECFSFLLSSFCLVFIMICQMHFLYIRLKFCVGVPYGLVINKSLQCFSEHLYVLDIFWCFHRASKSYLTAWGVLRFTKVLVGLYWYFLNQPNQAHSGLSKIPSLCGQCGGIVTSFSWFLCAFLLFPHTRLPGGFILPTPAEQTWQPPGDIMKVFFLPSGMYQCYEW